MRNIKFAFSTVRQVYIVAAKRTPIGAFLGKLSHLSGPELGGIAIKGSLDSIKLNPSQVDQVILGNVLSAGLGQAPARQASLKGGLGANVPCTTINKVCSSGLKSVIYGSQSIALGHSHTVVTGGFQSMSNAPHYVLGARKGLGYGDKKLLDSISHDGLTDAYNKISMGLCAQKTANDFQLSREAQDQYCKNSYQRVHAAKEAGHFINDIVGVQIKTKDKTQNWIQDQQPKRYRQDKISLLTPAFSKTGTITAANASKINDGACSIILMSQQKMKSFNLKPLAKIINYADHQLQPIDFSIAPHYAAKKAAQKANIKLQNIDYFQFNQAFSCVALANMKLLDISQQKTNVFGGAVALGHPIGASGARILQTLLTVLRVKGGKYGLAGICNGGGGASAVLVQNLQ